MAVKSMTYTGTPGSNVVSIPALVYRRIISVKKSGWGHDIVTDTPGNRQVQYIPAFGQFVFDTTFEQITYPDPTGTYDIFITETMHVIYE